MSTPNPVKAKLRKVVLGQVSQQIARVGEDKAIRATADILKASGSVSRAALMDIFLTLWNWGKLRKVPDEATFLRLSKLVEPLEDIDRANMVFSEPGEGGAWAYLDAIDEAAQDANNRFTREIRGIIQKARCKSGRPNNVP